MIPSKYPKPAKLVSKITLDDIDFIVMHFEHAGDYFGFRGPSDTSVGDEVYSFNVCSTSYSATFRREIGGPFLIDSKPAFFNTNYAENKSIGPFIVISEQDDMDYFCIKSNFNPLEFVMLDSGDRIDQLYKDWYCCVMTGETAGYSSGSIVKITGDNHVICGGKVCVTRLV
jgi:hypothetical protein